MNNVEVERMVRVALHEDQISGCDEPWDRRAKIDCARPPWEVATNAWLFEEQAGAGFVGRCCGFFGHFG